MCSTSESGAPARRPPAAEPDGIPDALEASTYAAAGGAPPGLSAGNGTVVTGHPGRKLLERKLLMNLTT